MADNEKKSVNKAEDKKPVKKDKPSIWQRIKNYFKGLKSEWKKISWANWKSVRTNTIIVLVVVIVIAIALGRLI